MMRETGVMAMKPRMDRIANTADGDEWGWVVRALLVGVCCVWVVSFVHFDLVWCKFRCGCVGVVGGVKIGGVGSRSPPAALLTLLTTLTLLTLLTTLTALTTLTGTDCTH